MSSGLLIDAVNYVVDQDARRGSWLRLRPDGDGVDAIEVPPYPAPDNAMFAYLLDQARVLVEERGVDDAIVWVAATAWLEGHVEGFDSAHAVIVGPDRLRLR